MKVLSFSLALCLMAFCISGFYSREKATISKSSKSFSFQGNVMVTNDLGKSWYSMDSHLPKDLDMFSFDSDGKHIFIGSDHAQLVTVHLDDFKKISRENLMNAVINETPIKENKVFGVFSCPSGLYTFVYGQGLFKKTKNTTLWQPISIPEGINGVSQVVEDTNGNVYLACQYGVYRYKKPNKSWDRIFQYGFANEIMLLSDRILVNGINGLYASEDDGQSWKHYDDLHRQFGVVNSGNMSLIKAGDQIFILSKSENSILSAISENKLLYSNDHGKTWNDHAASTFLSKQNNVRSIWSRDNKLFCVIQDAVMTSEDNGISWNHVLSMPKADKNKSIQLMFTSDKIIAFKVDTGC